MNVNSKAVNPRIRICVATSYGATEEPRGPRYAAALARLDPRFEVTFVDCVPRGRKAPASAEFRNLTNMTHRSWFFPWRGGGKLRLLGEKIRQRIGQERFRRQGTLSTELLSTRSIGLEKMLIAERADLYFGFNIDTLLPVYRAAQIAGAPFMFDCQEIHAEMPHHQSEMERAAILAIQRQCLPRSALVLAASPQAAAYIERSFSINGVLPLLNAAPLTDLPPCQPVGDFSLYWRNSTVDLGRRGLDDILKAMPLLPPGVNLYLQGRPSITGEPRVRQAIRELGVADRVTILPPYRMDEAVKTAIPYTVGLSLESPSSINLNLTSSNKFFDYAMAGLAIVSTQTEGMRHLVDDNALGLIYESGDAAALARQVMRLYEDRELLARMRRNARDYALREGNLEFQLKSFGDAFRQRVLPLLEARANSPGGIR